MTLGPLSLSLFGLSTLSLPGLWSPMGRLLLPPPVGAAAESTGPWPARPPPPLLCACLCNESWTLRVSWGAGMGVDVLWRLFSAWGCLPGPWQRVEQGCAPLQDLVSYSNRGKHPNPAPGMDLRELQRQPHVRVTLGKGLSTSLSLQGSEECPAQARSPPSFRSRGPEKPGYPPTCVLGGAAP